MPHLEVPAGMSLFIGLEARGCWVVLGELALYCMQCPQGGEKISEFSKAIQG